SKETWKITLAKMNATKRLFEEIAIRENRVYKKVMRRRKKPDEDRLLQKVSFKDTPLELVAPEFSDLKHLHFEKVNRVDPKDNEVEILIENTSINFKDYLKVTSRISSDAFEGTNSEDQV